MTKRRANWYRVYYRRNPAVTGWADPQRRREVKGIGATNVIRVEIYVDWDHTYPSGYIHSFEAVRVSNE